MSRPKKGPSHTCLPNCSLRRGEDALDCTRCCRIVLPTSRCGCKSKAMGSRITFPPKLVRMRMSLRG
eukprot:9158625-Pyramimonas_sp.AAC.1